MKRRLLFFTLSLLLAMNLFSVRAHASPGLPEKLEAPVISDLKLLTTQNKVPYFCLKVTVPRQVLDLDETRPENGAVRLEYCGKLDAQDWGSGGGGNGYLEIFRGNAVPDSPDTYYLYVELDNVGGLTETDVNDRNFTYRARFCYEYSGGAGENRVYSEWSNELSSGTSKYLGSASWANPELDRAYELGLISETIRGNMSAEITREEFAELAVMLYQAYTGYSAGESAPVFADTQNPKVSEACRLGLVQGVGGNRFDPDACLTREQMAAVMVRTLKAIDADRDCTVVQIPVYEDDESIAAYAKESVYVCAQSGIMNGIGNGCFAPGRNAQRQEAVIVCLRAYQLMKNNDMAGTIPISPESEAERP
jgi:hypothetical protein